MKLIIINRIKQAAVLSVLGLSLSVSAQEYGALQYTLQKRPSNEKFDQPKFGDHLFLSGGIGMHSLFTNEKDGMGLSGNVFIGKWFSPTHGLRIGGQLAFLPTTTIKDYQVRMLGGSVDYLLDLSALGYKYNFNRKFRLIGVMGLDAGYSRMSGMEGMYWGGHTGLQGNIRLSPTMSFFVEPRVGWYNKQITLANNWRGYNILGSVLAGFTYHMVPQPYRKEAPDFSRESFIDHLFISSFGGGTVLKNGSLQNSFQNIGAQFGLGVGKWFTPSSGIRLTGLAGFSDSPRGEDKGHLKQIQFRSDYLLNLDNAFGGYQADRRFNINAVAGFNFAMSKDGNNTKRFAPGLGAGIQTNFRLASNVRLFIEPRMNLFTNHFAGGRSYLNKDVLMELNAGITYEAKDKQARTNGNELSSNHFFDNMFLNIGGGAQLLMSKSTIRELSTVGPIFSASVGKWLTPSSGLRIGGQAGYFGTYSAYRTRHASISTGADYLWNIRSTFEGYDPDRTFHLVYSVGANLTYTGKMKEKLQPGIQTGLQALWNVGKNIGIYIEPQVRFYNDEFAPGNLGFIKKDAIFSLQGGLQYRFSPYLKKQYHDTYEKYDKHMFVSGAFGMSGLLVMNKNLLNSLGVGGQVSVGKWYTPLSAWRVSGKVMRTEYTTNHYLHYAGVELDYMMSLRTLIKGYTPENNGFDAVPFVGANFGTSYRKKEFAFLPGLNAGVQLKYAFNNIDLFVEPQIGIFSDRFNGIKNQRADRAISLLGGISYKPKGVSPSKRKEVEGFEKEWSLSFGMGTGLQSNSVDRRHFSTRYGVYLNRKFTALSEVRLGYSNTAYRMKVGDGGMIDLNAIHADYLLDLTTLLNGYSSDRKFELSGIAGVNATFSAKENSKASIGADMGLQAKWKLNKQFDLFVEPMINIYDSKAEGINSQKSAASCNITIGTSYHF